MPDAIYNAFVECYKVFPLEGVDIAILVTRSLSLQAFVCPFETRVVVEDALHHTRLESTLSS